ncbi:membrane protein DedA, SNARE-associated domain [Loktanella fryxellensis]|uniref:Membrane protein DedA, SNARE-associated domain n=2 Tax=Loktanella fryxellensis TaxID=245187 RepID=A0A1H8IQA7_9RHOB|nr:membrane protein DedA, SNARE-associated domain [Loktanella fryxellensis]
MVMVAGGFAAAGDFALWQLIGCAFAGFVLGDQTAFWLARRAGRPLIARFRANPRTATLVGRAEALVTQRGLLAVFLSRTVLSPLGPYVGYTSGALGLGWLRFTATAVAGGLLWCIAYAWLGYTFADRIAGIAALIQSSIGIVMAGAVTLGGLLWLIRAYRRSRAVTASPHPSPLPETKS